MITQLSHSAVEDKKLIYLRYLLVFYVFLGLDNVHNCTDSKLLLQNWTK